MTYEESLEGLAALNEHQPTVLDKDALNSLFRAIQNHESDIKEIRDEVKAQIESFAVSYGLKPKVVKETYKFFKNLQKDKGAAEADEFLRDKLVEALLA